VSGARASPPLAEDELELERVPCDLCGADETRERYKKPDARRWTSLHEFPVVECLSCGLVYVNPRPTPACMARFYDAGYHEGRDSERHLRRYARQLAFLEPLAGRRLLDVGCARGDFLAYLLDRHPDVQAVGVDAYSKGVRDPRIEFHARALPECGFPDAAFDLVTAWAVLEHLHAPDVSFREIHRILRPGGRFVFLVTNAESLYGKRAFREDVPRHTYHFSPAVLRRYAAKHGFEVARLAFDDTIFDGRGKGTFRWILARAAGVTWPSLYRGDLSLAQRAAVRVGKTLDRIVFRPHWEARLGRSGVIVVEFQKP